MPATPLCLPHGDAHGNTPERHRVNPVPSARTVKTGGQGAAKYYEAPGAKEMRQQPLKS